MEADLVVVGGGLAGVCCSITPAREGLKVILVQDRPVLGGNASSEVRLWVLGATSHMGNNNRWSREGGVIDELLVENLWRNPEGNAIIFDAVVLEWVVREPNITLLLNTAVDAVRMGADADIAGVSAFCSQNQTRYDLRSPLFCDASGDGIVGYLAGAPFRMGAEAREEFDEGLAPEQAQQTLLGHSLYFYSRDAGCAVNYIAPSFALQDITKIPRFRELKVTDTGCRLWWLEYGGNLDTVHETEEIKWELWKIAHGVWDYIKNSGNFPGAENLTLEWMGTIPGKRESRRFEGDYMLSQKDIVEQRSHFDAVSFGGWAIDLHPPEGVYSSQSGCEQWHSRGVYQIPYRSMYSRSVSNLFVTGRLISSTHIAFGSTRVMATCAHNAQAAGVAAAMCRRDRVPCGQVLAPARLANLQQRLLRSGQWIPGLRAEDPEDIAAKARISATSTLTLDRLNPSGEWASLAEPRALLFPLPAGTVPDIRLTTRSAGKCSLRASLWTSERLGNTTPDVKIAESEAAVAVGEHELEMRFGAVLHEASHVFLVLEACANVSAALSHEQFSGLTTVAQKMNKSVAKTRVQHAPEGSGIESFSFWIPERRPGARNLAVAFGSLLPIYEPTNVVNGYARPWCGSNAWMPDRRDQQPALVLTWDEPRLLREIQITFDTDLDNPMESVLMGHQERVSSLCARSFTLSADDARVIARVEENHHTRWSIKLDEPVHTRSLNIALDRENNHPAVFEVRCYE